jgi:hypothetical protein
MLGIANIQNAKTFDIIEWGQAGQYFNIATITATAVKMYDPRRLGPGIINQTHIIISFKSLYMPAKYLKARQNIKQLR